MASFMKFLAIAFVILMFTYATGLAKADNCMRYSGYTCNYDPECKALCRDLFSKEGLCILVAVTNRCFCAC
ncbi:hypothetical protein CASFOL_012646 [Castilleja foliolosa]|uniref:Uncharacterized protein n=1 Tax=Castilleja foliolosa TaxID=1961234 RepID=A0ABD3DLR5_9LAMI